MPEETPGQTGQPAIAWAESLPRVVTAIAHEPDLERMVSIALDETTRIGGARAAHVLLADEDQHQLRLVGHRNLPSDLVGRLTQVGLDAPLLAVRAASTKEVQVVSGAADLDPVLTFAQEALAATGARGMISLPLIAFDRLVGVLTYLLPEPGPLSPKALAALRAVADVLAVGMSHARASETEQRLRAQMDALKDAGLAISSTLADLPELDLPALLQTIVEQARHVTNAEYAALGIVADPSRPFDPWVFSGIPPDQAALIGPFPRPVGTLGHVARKGEAINVADLRRHPAFAGFPPHHPQMTSFLGVPIIYQGKSVGNLYLANKRGADRFTVEDQHAIEVLAAHDAAIVSQLPRLIQAIESERARLQTILESAAHGIVFVDAKTGRLMANPKAIQLIGRPLDPEAGPAQNVGWLCHPNGHPLTAEELPSSRALGGETVPEQELLVQRPDGSQISLLVSASPVRSPAGELIGSVTVFQDISRLKELERLREEWTSVIAHDLRQPLTVIGGYLGLLERLAERHDDPQMCRIVEHVRTATANLGRMIADLLDASRIEARRLTLERQPVDLAALISEVTERASEVTRGHPVHVEVKGLIAPVLADPGRIEQVLGNLLSNAAKHGYREGEILVEVMPRDGEVEVAVTNWGEGIPPEDVPRLFSRFHRTRQAEHTPGLGLGLYITRGLVEAHGGRIWAESTPGQTTTFRLTLPTGEPAS